VFIFGYEVTEDCDDISTNWTCARAPSSATIQLLNLNDKYIVRRDDMVALYPNQIKSFVDKAPDSELAKIYDRVVNDREVVKDSFNDPKSTKSRIMKIKRHPVYSVQSQSTDPFTGTKGTNKSLPIYPFIEGKSIFHQNDPVRIFVQDPFDPQVWYWWFSGSITQITDSVRGSTLEKTLSIQCEDVSKSLRYARITANPGFRDPKFFKSDTDIATFTGFSTPLQGKSFQEAADFLVFGDVVTSKPTDSALLSVPVVNPITGRTFNRQVLRTAAGNFKALPQAKRVFTLAKASNPQRAVTTLADWQNKHLNHVVDVADITTLRARSDNPEGASAVVERLKQTVATAQEDGEFTTSLTWEIMTEIGSNPADYPVDGGTLLMLLPEGLGKLGEDVVAKDFVSSISAISEFKDRRSVMYDLVSRVDFVFYADPKGNLVIEFPLFDFDPAHFQSVAAAGPKKASNDETLTAVRFTHLAPSGAVTFDNERRFTIEDEALDGWDATDSDAPVKTVAYKVPEVTLAFKAAQGTGARKPEVVKLDALIPIYGWRAVQSDPGKPVATERAALIACAIELNKANADAYTYKLPLLPRFSAWLNRPMLFRHRNHLGTVTSIAHKITWGTDARTTLNFNYARGWTGNIDEASGRMVYETIGGREARPINYAALFAQDTQANKRPLTTSSSSGVK
jgi:hypothetical protein